MQDCDISNFQFLSKRLQAEIPYAEFWLIYKIWGYGNCLHISGFDEIITKIEMKPL